MADVLVSGLVSEMLGRLTSVAIKEFGLVWGFNEDVSTLKDYFKQIQAVIQDAEKKRFKEASVELWLKRLRYESLKMENVFDEISTEVMLRKLHKELGIKYSVRAFFSSDHNTLMFRTRIAHKVKAIRKKIADIAAQRYELNLTQANGIINVDVDVGVWGEMPNRETSSLVHSSTVFGRNEEMKMLVEKICNIDIVGGIYRSNNVRVCSIWGMGGLGKTTLAQLVYNHENVNEHFKLKCWRYVSEKFHVKELIRGIIESIDKSECRLSQLDDLQLSLQEKLKGKRFLVVLDDVWIEESEKSEWDKLRITLSCGAEGSIVMVTTRNRTTSRMMVQVPDFQHELGCLSKDDSWSLFEKLAFAEGREGGNRRELEPIGREIVKKCKGLPLAVKTLGGLMWSKSSTSDWEHVMSSNIWELQDNNILPALKLSFDNLPPHIKRCFAYCSLFSKGYEMKKDLLIQLWMANGFIPPRGEASSYVLGEDIYNFLTWRSFFQVVDGKYKMHDLMHDLAQYVMRDDCLVIEPGKNPITPEDVLHLSSSCPHFVFSNKDLKRLRSLRSIFIYQAYDYKGSISRIFELVYLRVLCLFEIQSLPESICKLKYLKYLNLSYSKIQVLPESIIYLQNLRVLILERCLRLRKLPQGIRYMRNLQHLNIKHCGSLEYLPVGILKGVNDLRFTDFPVGKKKGAKIGELGDVINLVEDTLKIRGLENFEGGLREVKNANLKSKTNLLVLRLHWEYNYLEDVEPERIALDEEVLEGLEPNPSLKVLEIDGYTGKNISSSWILDLNNLVRINFYDCKKCENIPPFGKLPNLSVIDLSIMYSLKCFHDEDTNTSKSRDNTLFPVLQVLFINACPNLVSLPSYFRKLNRLHITYCKSLLSLPVEIQSFKDLNELQIIGCETLSRRYDKETDGVDWPKISHVPNITIDEKGDKKSEEHGVSTKFADLHICGISHHCGPQLSLQLLCEVSLSKID